MPAPKRVELPRHSRPCRFCWKVWLSGVAVGTLGCWLVMSGAISLQSLTRSSGKEDIPVKAQQPPSEKDILDTLPIEFYKLLPSREEPVEPHIISQQIREDSSDVSTHKPGQYRLQAGSFQKPEDADRRRASISILGLEAGIEKVTHGHKTWYRVMLGPFESLRHLEAVRHRLSSNNIDSIVLRLKSKS